MRARKHLDRLDSAGVQVVAISPDSPAESRRLAEELDLPFEMLSDPGLETIAGYGALGAEEVYPSAFLVAPNGGVLWSYVGKSPVDQPRIRQLPLDRLNPVERPAHHYFPPTLAALLGKWPAWFIGLGFIALAVFAALANQTLLAWDQPVREVIQSLDDGIGEFLRRVGRLGSRWVIGALTIPTVAIAWNRCRQLSYVLVGAFATSFVLEIALKATISRPRPPLGLGFGASFPSGHVLAAAAFWGLMPALIFLVTAKRWTWVASVAAAILILLGVGASRVYLGAHWPSDVVGGYLGGTIFLLIAEWMIHRPVLNCEECALHPIRRSHGELE